MQKNLTILFLMSLFSNSFITSQEERVPKLFDITLEYIKNNFDSIPLKQIYENPLFEDLLEGLIYRCFEQQIIPPIYMKNKKKHIMCFYPKTLPNNIIIYDHNECCSLTLNYSSQQYETVATSVTLESPHIVEKRSLGAEENSPIACLIQIPNHEPDIIAIARESGLLSIFHIATENENHIMIPNGYIGSLSYDPSTGYILTDRYSTTHKRLDLMIIHPDFPNFLTFQDLIKTISFGTDPSDDIYSRMPNELLSMIPHRYLSGNFTLEEQYLLFFYSRTLLQLRNDTLDDNLKSLKKQLKKDIKQSSLEPVVRKHLVELLKEAILDYKNNAL